MSSPKATTKTIRNQVRLHLCYVVNKFAHNTNLPCRIRLSMDVYYGDYMTAISNIEPDANYDIHICENDDKRK